MIEQFASKMGRPKINESGFAIVPLSCDYRSANAPLSLPLSQSSQETLRATNLSERVFLYPVIFLARKTPTWVVIGNKARHYA